MARATLTLCASFYVMIIFIHGYSGIQLQYEECEFGDSLISNSNVTYPEYGSQRKEIPVMVNLDDPAGLWRAFFRSTKQFLVVDLGSVHIITRVSTKGRHGKNEFVKEYALDYSSDNKAWIEYTNELGLPVIFKGNNDSENVAENSLKHPIIAHYIKFKVIRFHRSISMSVDVIGCRYVPEPIHTINGGHIVHEVSCAQFNSTDVITLRFRTTHENGIIFYAMRNGEFHEFMLLELRQGELRLKIDLMLSASLSGLTEVAGGRYLNDGLWHDVIFTRNGSMAKLIVDRYEIDFRIKHRFIRFKPNGKIFIGGVDNLHSKELSNSQHFTGCIDRLRYNGINMIKNVKDSVPGYLTRGPVAFKCSLEVDDCFSLSTNTSSLLYSIQEEPDISVGFEFKTIDKVAIIFRYHESNDSGVQLEIDQDGYLQYIITYEDGVFTDTIRKVDIDGNVEGYTDGLWHSFIIHVNTTNINVTVDGYSRLTTKNISVRIAQEFQFGYNGLSKPGFIGCLRNITIGSVPKNSLHFQRYDLVTISPCVIEDKCKPNLCKHNGKCRQDADTFYCDCGNTGYTGAFCHISIHPSSCAVYNSMTLNPWMSQKETSVIIDPDGSGPLNPFLVDCQFESRDYYHLVIWFPDDSLQNVKTSVSHDVEEPVTVDGYQEPNYYSHLYIETYGYWVGRTNQNMFYGGGSAPGTYQCACGVSDKQPCILGMRSCNCDSGETDTADYGYITQKQYFPVMELHFGDTGTLNDNKVGQYQLGKLECYGDSILDNTVTFRKKDATLEFAPFEAGIAVDIWFQFKTSAPDGVLIHNTGDINDTFIKIELKDGYIELSFNYNAGYRIQTLDYRANLSDDTWHTVHVERNIRQAYLRIDNFQAVFADEPSDHIPRLLELTKPLTVGATVDYENGFVGCMRGLRVNGILVDMRGAVHNGQFTYGVQEGCVRKCASNPCFNGGVCIERYSHYTCNCTNTPFAGRFCSKEVGVHMEMNYMIHYNFEKLTNYQPHTVMNVKVGFKTKKKQGILIQLRDGTEYVTLAMNNNGGVKFHLDIGYERWELNTAVFDIDFTDGRPHMVTFRRDVQKVYLQVDEFPSSSGELSPHIISSNIFQNFKQLFIGNNATSSFWNGFEGCIYHIQIDDILPLKTAFEDPRSVTFTPSENLIRETTCGFEEVTRAPEPVEVRIDPDPIDEWVPRPICGSPIPPPVEDRGGKHIEDGDLFFTFPREDIILNAKKSLDY